MDHIIDTMNDFIEDLETQEVLARHDERNCYEAVVIDGRKRTLVHRSMQYLFAVEQFVKAIEEDYAKKGKAKGISEWVGRDGSPKNEMHLLGKQYYGELNEWIERYREGARYCPYVEAFHDACKELGIIGKRRFWFGELGDTDWEHDRSYADWFNDLIVKIHERCQSRKFKERERLLKIHVQRNIDNVTAFEEELFSDEHGRASWLVIELTLQYESKYRESITLDDVLKHRDKFFRARKYNKLMSCIKAYVWAIEEGEDAGFHLHVILFCLPVTKNDERLANQIGDYWADVVTEGRGKYWNSNREDLKPGYERKGHGVGVGLIDHRDSKMRGSLLANLLYLAKAEQQLQIRAEGNNVHTFGMSDVPKKLKAGRPRNVSAIGAKSDGVGQSTGMQREGAGVHKGSVNAVVGSTARVYKSGVPLPFPIEATVFAA